jgi:mannose-6-phosphate isomerase-like protein (cupin superfamily)
MSLDKYYDKTITRIAAYREPLFSKEIGMRRPLLLAVFFASTSWLWAADPEGFGLWKGSVVMKSGNELAGKIDDQKFAWQSLGTYGNHLIGISHREGDGSAELHETQADIMVVDEGEATLIVGGTMVNPKTVKPHEVRGSSIEGGETKQLGPGDIVHIPAKVPHQLKIKSGTKFTYTVVKVDTN